MVIALNKSVVLDTGKTAAYWKPIGFDVDCCAKTAVLRIGGFENSTDCDAGRMPLTVAYIRWTGDNPAKGGEFDFVSGDAADGNKLAIFIDKMLTKTLLKAEWQDASAVNDQ